MSFPEGQYSQAVTFLCSGGWTWLAGTYSRVTVDDCVQCRQEDIPNFRRECVIPDLICIYRVVIDILSSQLKWSRLVQREHRCH